MTAENIGNTNIQKATFGNGCFWCTEAIFQTVIGVHTVTSGYTGGAMPNPTYWDVCGGHTDHAEAIEIEFDADEISYEELLYIFFRTHNPTSRNRQGNDLGSQYRSVIFYHDDEQKLKAEAMINYFTEQQVFERPITTQIIPAGQFYKAEERHQNYYVKNAGKPYCVLVILPKINRFADQFKEKIKPEVLQ